MNQVIFNYKIKRRHRRGDYTISVSVWNELVETGVGNEWEQGEEVCEYDRVLDYECDSDCGVFLHNCNTDQHIMVIVHHLPDRYNHRIDRYSYFLT